VTGLVAAKAGLDCRFSLRNAELAVHYLSGETERRRLATSAELRATLEQVFRIMLPEAPELRPTLDRLVSRAA
jgi:N-hydroxyarylamine O-acetyltransferase